MIGRHSEWFEHEEAAFAAQGIINGHTTRLAPR